VSVDAETADSELTEYQPGPSTDGTRAQNIIRPAGLHYDYTVASHTLGATLAVDWQLADRWALSAALRADQTRYDYDNLMIDGNTNQNGVPCPGAGCLYSRPADRDDEFDNLAPKVTLSWQPGDRSMVYVSGSSGYRPPEMTEMYRLQRQQSIADLDSEQLDSLEAGWKYRGARLSLDTAVFAMDKKHVIMRDANGFNLSNGSTTHRGVEYELHYQISPMFLLNAAGTFARHEYDFSAHVDGGENIIKGNDVDTAPHQLGTLGLDARFSPAWNGAINLEHVGKYFLDAANTVTYPGHTLANLRVQWLAAQQWRATLRVDNVFDTAYADRADYAFGSYRYFPGRGRAFFLALDYSTD
jgi:outer membrane receptor protein involved in Fe transport